MIDMLAKSIIFCLLAAAVIAAPVDLDEEEDDLPVYTEKVHPGKPTQVPKFGSKKLSVAARREPERLPLRPRHDPTSVPRPILKTAKPIRGNTHPVRRTNRISPVPSDGFNEIKPVPTNDYLLSPGIEAARGLGVEYAKEDEAPRGAVAVGSPSVHEDVIEDYKPRRVPKVRAAPLRTQRLASVPRRVRRPEIAPPVRAVEEYQQPDVRVQHPVSSDVAVGNAPQLRYAVAPENFVPAPARIAPEYGYAPSSHHDEAPHPYVFGYELKDEHGSTQNRREQGDDYGNKRGSYGYTDGYGIYRQVDYVADAHGFRAVVKTNEPGVDNQNPADVEIQAQ